MRRKPSPSTTITDSRKAYLNIYYNKIYFNTLRTGDADLRFYITTVKDG